MSVPTLKLADGVNIPVIGLGTWKSKPNEVKQAVKDAINAGYTHLDCAHAYENHKEVGEAIKESIAEGKIKREDLFITTKDWCTFHSKGGVHEQIKIILADLDVAYIDLFLIHWPMGLKEGGELFPTDENGHWIGSEVDYVETWKAMEEVQKKGLTKSIGVSNFNSEQIKRILEIAEIKPVTNQVECHPYLQQKKLHKFCKEHGITITAYSPFGSPDRPWAKSDDPSILTDPVIKTIAMKYGKSVAQVVLRFIIQNDMIVIPKSVTKARIEENFKVFDFTLSDEDVKLLESLDRHYRALPMGECKNHKYYPFDIQF
jgi:aldehyde reductase